MVLGHSIIIIDSNWGIYTPTYPSQFLFELKKALNGFQMHLFFSISGFLFFNTIKHTSSLKTLIKKKIV